MSTQTLKKTEPLDAEEEKHLVLRAQAGDTRAVERLITSQIPGIVARANEYATGGEYEVDDLISAAMEAFLRALETFEVERGVRLFTHAQYGMREAMASEKAASSVIPVPGRTLRKYRKALRDAEQAGNPEGGRDRAMHREGLAGDTFDAVRFALSRESLYATEDDGDEGAGVHGLDALDSEALPLGSRPHPGLATVEDREAARAALAALESPRERRVVFLTILRPEPLTDEAAGRVLGVSRHTVARARASALATMREVLA